ncbi:cardiolipin synthase [Mucilaginibacter paludis]|uniref:Cardiolipin synthase n=1 Tax=Mucilaginibacter paludis DSM 18603 TaxID=714943 RepID=H1Y548_9SPHI|nr:cardiolipin synthase [Mucilaginibacter paludis]EHQ28591.1 phospholipase D/Transphosphatidylase [Mucilaginibacter paludis DSM 18603]
MNWILLFEIFYSIIVVLVCLRIIYDTRSTSKTSAYLLLTLFLPGLGMIIYFVVGANYRKNKLYSKKIVKNNRLLHQIKKQIYLESEKTWDSGESEVKSHKKLARLLLNDSMSPLTGSNEVKLLLNGENKFPEVLKQLKEAKHHIHIEYYIFEDEVIGNQIKDILIAKAREGVTVRFIYDDFGSRSIRKKLVPELLDAGVQAFPFYQIYFMALANRINYRNHRKIIIIDGCTGFVGGINVSDRYINDSNNTDKVFWRDTHVMIKGPGVYYLQYLFICDWNFCAETELEPQEELFCAEKSKTSDAIVQIAASGPDSETPTIMFSLIQAIGMAEEEILISTPYFIPGETLIDALNVAAMSGVKVKLLVPGKSDSAFVDSAARSYYQEILRSGVEIYLYQKGFMHAKTMVLDGSLSIIGTANMDHRSFELNFEVNSMVYDNELSNQLRDAFYQDLEHSTKINSNTWAKRPLYKQLPERITRLLSPLL